MASDPDRGWASLPGFEGIDAAKAPPDPVGALPPTARLKLPPPTSNATTTPPDGLPPPLVAELEAPPRRWPPAPPPHGPSDRMVVLVTIALLAIVGLSIAYSTTRPPRPVPPRPVPTGPTRSTEAAKPPSPPEPEASPAPLKRMVTIVSTPPGARVEINGVPHGKTAVVKAAPEGVEQLEVTLRLEGYATWREQVRPNANGHYEVNARLSPRGPAENARRPIAE